MEESSEIPQNSSAEQPKLPGEPQKARPIQIGGEFFDPLNPPKLIRRDDGSEELIGGKKLDKDTVYAERFWEKQPKGMKEAMTENVLKAVKEGGNMAHFVSPNGITEADKKKLSAYRKLADELGYYVGQYKFNEGSDTVTASITPKGK